MPPNKTAASGKHAATVTISARVPEQLGAAIEAVALISGDPVSAHIRTAVEEYLAKNWRKEDVLSRLNAAYARRQQEEERLMNMAAEALE